MTGHRRLTAVLIGALTASLGYTVSRRVSRLGPAFDRVNHAGASVTLLEGPAYALAAAAASALAGPAGPVAVLGAAGFGAVDDFHGDGSKGLRGHLRALASGRVTSGLVKIVGIGATGALTAFLVRRGTTSRGTTNGQTRSIGRAAGLLADAALIAGSANLANLFDLRPGRALKVSLLAALTLTARPDAAGVLAAAAAGSALGVLAPDLRGDAMLGDTGANAAGALVGTALVHRLGPEGRLAGLAVVVGLTLASERVSFTRVIEATPGLRQFDAWGRG